MIRWRPIFDSRAELRAAITIRQDLARRGYAGWQRRSRNAGQARRPSRYEPGINRTYQDHYDCVVLPARIRHPPDKAFASYCTSSS